MLIQDLLGVRRKSLVEIEEFEKKKENQRQVQNSEADLLIIELPQFF